MNLQEIELKKQELFRAQQNLAEELAALQKAEQTIAKESRRAALEKIEELIAESRIPKSEILEIYQRNDLDFRRPYTKRRNLKEEAAKNPQLDLQTEAREIAEQLNKLHASGNVEAFKLKLDEIGDKVEDVLGFVNEATESAIIEALS